MSDRLVLGSDLDLTRRRGLLILATTFAVAWLAPGPGQAALLLVPYLVGSAAVHFFRPTVLQRWIRRGFLIVADVALVALALAGSGAAGPGLYVGLFALVLLAILTEDRIKTTLGGFALLLLLLAWSSSMPEFPPLPSQAHLLFLPILIAAAFHLGYLAEQLSDARKLALRAQQESAELWALLEITDTITSTLEITQVMHSIVERVGDLVDTPSCSILLADAGSPDCYIVASKGHPEADMMEIDLVKYPEIRQALRTREPVMIDEISTHPLVAPVREMLLDKGYRSILVLPLLFGKEVLGALFLRSPRVQSFSPTVLRFCKVAACVSANALKNATLYRDVTRVAAQHQETGEKLKRVLDSTPDMIVATDGEGRLTQFNRGAELLSGRSAGEVTGLPFSEILGFEPTEDSETPEEVTLQRPDGDKLDVSLVSAPLCDAAGNPSGRVWIGRDVTKLRRVERSLVQAERLSSLGEVVAGVAHELNNPLSGVVGYAELLRTNAQDPEQIRDLQKIVESSMRCQKIVFKLLSFARKHAPEKRFQDLNDCVKKVLDLKSYHLKSSQVVTELSLDPDLPKTNFDFHQVEQVILNLLNNAEQAVASTSHPGRITLRTFSKGEQVVLEVQDNGPGIEPGVSERVFDPFFTTKDIGEGTGLGLSVSYGIVHEHAGELEYSDAEPGPGACFRMSLPILEGQEVSETERTEVRDRIHRSLFDRRILVAEDDPTVLELFSRLLKDEGAHVTLARDGDEAWRHLEHQSFDLIVADLRMPNVSGQQLYDRVAEDNPAMLRRFVFATGDLVREDTLAFLRGLPNRILTKPLEVETVRRVLSQALETAA